MIYKLRPGIELLNICGTKLLVGTRDTWPFCPHVRHMPKGAAVVWSLLSKGKKVEHISKVLALLSNKSVASMTAEVNLLIEQLIKEGYLIKED